MLPREKFAELYDPLAKEASAYPAMIVRALAGDAPPFVPELEQAVEKGFFLPLCQCLAEAKALVPAGSGSTQSNQIRVQLQAMVNPAYGTLPVGALLLGPGQDALKRVCKITVDSEGHVLRGSGFLIGQDTVVTAHHVVSDLLDTGQQRPQSHQQISVVFDAVGNYLQPRTVKAAESWYVKGSKPHPSPRLLKDVGGGIRRISRLRSDSASGTDRARTRLFQPREGPVPLRRPSRGSGAALSAPPRQ